MYIFFKKIGTFIIAPFKQELSFYCFLFFLISFVCFFNRVYYISLREGIAWLVVSGIMSYLFCLPLFLIKGAKLKRIYKGLLIILGILSTITDLVLSFVTSAFFLHYVTIILGTNLSEILGFIQNFFDFRIFIGLLVVLLLIFVVWKLSKLIKTNKYIVSFGVISLVVGSYLVRNGGTYIAKNIFIGKIYAVTEMAIEQNRNLEDYYTMPEFVISQSMPQNLVIVIGESLQRDFCSLYGYDKNTNPLLSTMVDSLLYLFSDVSSPDVATVPCLQRVLSTLGSHNLNKKWYECLPLPKVLSNLGYETYWISNQAQAGLFDNVIVKYANLCDSTMFVGTHYGISTETTVDAYDEVVLEPLNQLLNRNSSKKVFFVHLMGNHYAYSSRYPKDRAIFCKNDYTAYAQNQREKRAHYDNSIVYNDSVVYQVFDKFKDMECLGFYFSDHGQDIYETDPNYAGHGRYGEPESERIGKRIPFMAFMSQMYQNGHKKELEMVRNSKDVTFNTEDFMYSLMDILGVSFKDNDDVKKYSLFSKE